jgi:16S rRNA (cytosine967-C5)-methyltransferase
MHSADRREVLSIALSVIRQVSRTSPADFVLRKELTRSALPQRQKSRVANLVFAYYRWFGFLDCSSPLPRQLEEAQELETRFEHNAQEFSAEELRQKAIPCWAASLLNPTDDFLRELQKPPALWVRVRDETNLGSISKSLQPHPIANIPQARKFRGEEDLFLSAAFKSGALEIQDIASQAVVQLCEARHGEVWWDVCAGEGGKTIALGDALGGKGMVVATDRSIRRLEQLRKRAARARLFNYQSQPWEDTQPIPLTRKYDGILIDAPCSGIGTWQKNPHARWTTDLQDVEELALLQRAILQQAVKGLKKGGRLIYSVCTLAPQETIEQAAAFTAANVAYGLHREPLTNPFTGTQENDVWLLPQQTGGIGMFVAAWRREK